MTAEGLRVAVEGLRLAKEGLRLAGFMKVCVVALWCYRVVFTGWFLQGSVSQGGMGHAVGSSYVPQLVHDVRDFHKVGMFHSSLVHQCSTVVHGVKSFRVISTRLGCSTAVWFIDVPQWCMFVRSFRSLSTRLGCSTAVWFINVPQWFMV